MNETISIIVPVYKAETTLRRCVESLRQQTYSRLEIILVDDGSPDQSPAICDSLAAEDSRIRVIHQENRGVSAARNAGLDVATGAYIGFVDSDDWVDAEMFGKLLAACREQSAKIAVCGYIVEAETWRREYPIISPGPVVSGFEARKMLIADSSIQYFSWNKLYKSQLLSDIRFPVGVRILEEGLLQHRAFAQAEQIAVLPEPLYHYVSNDQSVTRKLNPEVAYGYYEVRKQMRISLLDEFPEQTDCLQGQEWMAAVQFLQSCESVECSKDLQEKTREVRKELRGISPWRKYRAMGLRWYGDYVLFCISPKLERAVKEKWVAHSQQQHRA